MSENKLDSVTLWGGLFLLLIVMACGLTVLLSEIDPVECGCGTQDTDIADVDEVDEVNSRKVYKVWFSPGGLGGVSEEDFQRRVMAGFNELSLFTRADFVQVPTIRGSHTRVYPASDEMMWRKKPAYKKDKLIPLELQAGNWMYFTIRPRWGSDQILEAAAIHGMGHRVNLKHSGAPSSIMNANLTSVTLNGDDTANFIRRLGAK